MGETYYSVSIRYVCMFILSHVISLQVKSHSFQRLDIRLKR
jgi:hypothetical protein